jgi:hypothetical protein
MGMGTWALVEVEFKIMNKELRIKNGLYQKSYVLPHMWTLDQGQTQQWDRTLST